MNVPRLLGLAFFLSAPLLAADAVRPPAGWTLIPNGQSFRSLADYRHSLRLAEGSSDGVAIHSTEFEIRRAGDNVRIARFADPFELDRTLEDKRALRRQGNRDSFTKDELREIGELSAGEYRIAYLANGVRASNVVAIRIDPTFDPAKAPTLTLGALEAGPAGKNTVPILWSIGPSPALKNFTNYNLFAANITVDGIVRRRYAMVGTGAAGVLANGQRSWVLLNAPYYAPAFALDGKHTYAFEFAGFKAGPIEVDPADRHLAEEWDRGTATRAVAKETRSRMHGRVTGMDGKPVVGCPVSLRTNSRDVAETLTNELGEYSFTAIPAGRYRLAAQQKKAQPESVTVNSEGDTVLDIDFRSPTVPSKRTVALEPLSPIARDAPRYIDLKKVTERLGHGLDVNVRAKDGNTPLAIAAMTGRLELVKGLLEAGANPNARLSNNYTVLRYAVRGRHLDVVDCLLAHGANVNQPFSESNETALMDAAESGQIEIVRLLIAQGAKVNERTADGHTALTKAVRRGQVEVIRLLLANGADVRVVDEDGLTLLMHAARGGLAESIQPLLDAGADPNETNMDGFTALYLASCGMARAEGRDFPGVIKALLKGGARRSPVTPGGDSPFVIAAKVGSFANLEPLAGAGVDLRSPTGDGAQAAYEAVVGGKREALAELLRLGLDPNIAIPQGVRSGECEGVDQPLLFHAIFYASAVDILLKAKADPNIRCIEPDNEITPLMAAVRHNNPEVVRLLLSAGADRSDRDDAGKVAADYNSSGNPEITQLLGAPQREDKK